MIVVATWNMTYSTEGLIANRLVIVLSGNIYVFTTHNIFFLEVVPFDRV